MTRRRPIARVEPDEDRADVRLVARLLVYTAYGLAGSIAFLLASIVAGIGVRMFLTLAGFE